LFFVSDTSTLNPDIDANQACVFFMLRLAEDDSPFNSCHQQIHDFEKAGYLFKPLRKNLDAVTFFVIH